MKDLGNKAFTAGKFEEAIEHFTEAISMDSTNHVLFSNRSAAFASLKKYREALSDAEKTVSIKADWAKVRTRGVCVCVQQAHALVCIYYIRESVCMCVQYDETDVLAKRVSE